jgi:hypothetical protein
VETAASAVEAAATHVAAAVSSPATMAAVLPIDDERGEHDEGRDGETKHKAPGLGKAIVMFGKRTIHRAPLLAEGGWADTSIIHGFAISTAIRRLIFRKMSAGLIAWVGCGSFTTGGWPLTIAAGNPARENWTNQWSRRFQGFYPVAFMAGPAAAIQGME